MPEDSHKDTSILHLLVHPNADSNEIVSFTGGILRVKVAAPPIKGKANQELAVFLSQALGVSKSSVTIAKGHTSHNKAIAVNGLNQKEIMNRLFPEISSSGDASKPNQPSFPRWD
ncbi:DUF167 domain-containing protein [Chloroflexota bacterium]